MFYSNYGKRILDIALILIGFLILCWLFIFILIVYVALFEFPIFFKQYRTGKNGEPFVFWKFRTLKVAESDDSVDRSFGWGKFLRFTSLDELPQLFNVLKGEMSLVGPRPLPVDYEKFYSASQRQRHLVRPGITGWAQVNGKNSIPWERKFELDNYYVNNLSLKLDLLILIKTVVLLFSFNKDVSLKEKKFTGS
ncbi:MAG: sugar transferase [Bacteroidetes bacterium]|nr:sugar transferase [Bacteroidota bacterium]